MRGKAFFLDSAGFHHALAYRFATFGRASVGYLLERDRHDFYLYIDPVEQRGRKHDSCISGQHPENRDKGDRGDYNIRKDKDSWKRPT